MPTYLDIAARDLTTYKKGDVVGISIEGKQCSVDPSGAFIGLIISDATREEVHHYIHDWQIDFEHTLISENASGWRYKIKVDPVYISASNIGKAELKTGMQNHITSAEYWAGSSVFSFTTSSMTVDIPKNGTYQTTKGLSDVDYLKLLKADFRDIFKVRLNASRYHFSDADVDQVIADGGSITLTKAQTLNKVIDKLGE